MAPGNHDDIEPASISTWCVLGATCLAVLLPLLTALVTGSTAVSEALPAALHPPLTPPPPTTRAPKCDRMFISNPDGPKNGTFSAPLLENPTGHSRQCIYTFIAAENERVQVSFTSFSLRGAPPECNHEYVDLYTEIEDPSTDLISTPFGGRYCGRNLPRRRISMHQTLVVGFYTDELTVSSDVFQGTYEFIDAAQYVVGTPTPDSICSFTIYSDRKREGEFLSPTYPGVYPKHLQCQYRFLGRKGQRVRLEFMDFDLIFGGSHCPFDYVKVYDGSTVEDNVIGTYCGQQRNLVVYSSSENLLVQFITLQRAAENENRGFAGWFEFSERFVSLDFIGKNDGEHIRGTECDQKILSKKESTGKVYSPNYPFPYHPNIICRYYIYGLQDAQHLEKVRLEFDKFEIPSNDAECSDGYLRIFLQGQEERQAFDEFDFVFCGQNLPPAVVSEGPRLSMVFSSGSAQGPGFKARYTFETDYKIPGTPSPEYGCHFTYQSTSQRTGEFNSPRYPANYPSNTSCQFIFWGEPGEQVKFVFNYFKTKTKYDISIYGYNEICQEDWVEIYEIFPSGRESKFGRYCAKTAPGPIISDVGVNTMKVILHTDAEGVASGFSAMYNFIPAMSKFGDCGYNISSQDSGVITSPGFPSKYKAHRQVCNWYISVRPHHKILFLFTFFHIEGDPGERGCSGAVMRVWKDLSQPPIELCGPELVNETQEIISVSSVMKLTFASADKSIGAEGFKATWTEIKEGSECNQFQCSVSKFCIAESLKCNGLPNCGWNDNSDELDCFRPPGVNIYLVLGLSIGGVFFMILTICLVCHRKRKRRRHRHHHHHHPPPPPFEPRQKSPREVSGLHFMTVDSV